MRPVSLLAVLATVLGFVSGCSAGSGLSIAPNVRGTVAGPSEGGEGVVPVVETPAPAAAGSDVLGPRADSERFPTDLFSAEAFYGENFQTRIYSRESDFAYGVLIDESGRLTLPLFVHYVLRTEGTFFNWIESPGLQIRIVHIFLDSERNKRYRYCDALTTARMPDGSNVLFSNLDLRQGGTLSVFMKDPAGQTSATLTSGFVDLGGLFLMQTLTLEDPGLKPSPGGDGLFHILEMPDPSATIDSSQIPNIPFDARFMFPDSSR